MDESSPRVAHHSVRSAGEQTKPVDPQHRVVVLNERFSSGRRQEVRARHESGSASCVHLHRRPQADAPAPSQPADSPRMLPMHVQVQNSPTSNRGKAGRSTAQSASASSLSPPAPSSPPSASPSRNGVLRDAGSRAAGAGRRWLRASPSGATIRRTEPEK